MNIYSNYRPLAAAVSFKVHAEHEALLCNQVFSTCKLNALTTELQTPDEKGNISHSTQQRIQWNASVSVRNLPRLEEN